MAAELSLVSSHHQDELLDESFLLLLSPDECFPYSFFEANPPNINTQQPPAAAAAAAADHHWIHNHNNMKETSTNTLNEEEEESPKVEQDLVATIETNGNENMYQECDDEAHTNTNMGHEPRTLSLCMTTKRPKPKLMHTFPKRSSIYRGVTRHRYTGRYEAHLWDGNSTTTSTTNQGRQPPRKGRQVYLGGYDMEENAARAYDLAALKYWGTTTTTNFPISNYSEELGEMKLMTKQEHVASIRRRSSGFSRGVSIYRGVTRHHQHGRWQARIGRVARNKDLYLGTFNTQEEAAEAYDIAAIKFRGLNAVTNFEINSYDVKSIMENGTLPIRGGGGVAKRLKDAENTKMALHEHTNVGSSKHGCPAIAFQAKPLSIYPYAHQTVWSKQVHDSDVGDGSNDAHLLQLGSNQDDDHMISVASSPGEQSSDLSSSVGSFIVMPPMMRNDDKALVCEGLYGSTDADYKATNVCYQSSWDGPAGDNTVAVCLGASLNGTLN